MGKIDQQDKHFEILYDDVSNYIREARSRVVKSVNHEIVLAYWQIGKRMVEVEQESKLRAKYGEKLLESLSKRLIQEFGKGFGVATLRNVRQFFLIYKDRIHYEARSESNKTLPMIDLSPNLSWTHYRTLMRESRTEVRGFYEKEAIKNNWSTPELQRQMGSFLFERLAKSKDKKGLLQLAKKGQIIEKPEDVIKSPVVLEFLDLPESHKLTETKLEEALISHLQHFLLELGRGFAFVGRQKRITLDSYHFYPDLVFYHIILKCYVVIDLKIGALTHNDIGQMQMYVNYFDREIATKNEKPTIGMLLCEEKSDLVVEYTLGDNKGKIFANEYKLHLPSRKELNDELGKEIEKFKQHKK